MHTKHSAPSTNCVKPHFHAVSESSATWLEAIYSCCPVCPANISAYLIAILLHVFSHAQASNKAGILNLRRKTFMRQNISTGYSWSWSARIQPFTLPHGLVSRRERTRMSQRNCTNLLLTTQAPQSRITDNLRGTNITARFYTRRKYCTKTVRSQAWPFHLIDRRNWALLLANFGEFGRDYKLAWCIVDCSPQSAFAFPLWVSSFNLIICWAGELIRWTSTRHSSHAALTRWHLWIHKNSALSWGQAARPGTDFTQWGSMTRLGKGRGIFLPCCDIVINLQPGRYNVLVFLMVFPCLTW